MISRKPTFTIIVLTMCITSSKANALASLFVYDREAIFRGELWRLITSHLVHFNNTHLIYNLIVFGVIGWIIEYKGYKNFKLLCLLMAFSISVVLIFFKPEMAYFGGLSGIACGTIAYCSFLCLREQPPWQTLSKISLVFLFLKICLEIYNRGSILPYWETQDFIPIPLSHIVGFITAFAIFFAVKGIELLQNKSNSNNSLELNAYKSGAFRIDQRF